MKIGLVGLGRMGTAISQRLNERGCEVAAWDRNAKAVEAQAKRGLRTAGSARAVAAQADVVLSIITEDKGVQQIFTGGGGPALFPRVHAAGLRLSPAAHSAANPKTQR
jgi:3-hydroxyisobutyrate dehydrogenase-like beta-hydroxyacid dehydrogenase